VGDDDDWGGGLVCETAGRRGARKTDLSRMAGARTPAAVAALVHAAEEAVRLQESIRQLRRTSSNAKPQ
jgi:hypothetical protein